MTAARPLSDMAGLAAAVGAQAMAVTAGSVRALGALRSARGWPRACARRWCG